MPAAYVRDTGAQTGSDIDTDAASFASLPAAGNGVFVFITMYSELGGFSGGEVTDNQSNTYGTHLVNVQPNACMAIFGDGAIGTPSGTFTITINPVGSSGIYAEWIAVEFSGIDALVGDQLAYSTTTSNTPTVTSGTTTYADELVMGLFTSVAGSAAGIDPAAGYTTLHLHDTGSDTVVHYSAYKIVSSIGTQNFNAGTTNSSTAHTIGVLTWKGTAATGADNVYNPGPGIIIQAVNRGATF